MSDAIIRVWLVESSGEIKGVAYIRIWSHEGETRARVHGLYLTPEVLGKGFGGQLLRLMIHAAKTAGVQKITLESSLNAHEFYKRFGFRDTGPMASSEIGGSMVRGFPMSLDIV